MTLPKHHNIYKLIWFLILTYLNSSQSETIPINKMKNLTFVRKCCPLGFDFINKTCDFPSEFNFEEVFHEKFGNAFEFIYGNGCPENSVKVLISPDAPEAPGEMPIEFNVLANGDLQLSSDSNLTVEADFENYCVDFIDNHDIVTFSVEFCHPIEESKYEIFMSYGMIISMPFLLATFIVYALLPERNLHQNALMFYVITLFFSYVLLVVINLNSDIEEAWCIPLGYSTLFFFMVSFFWMNVICLDIWFTFSGSRGFVGSQRSSERRRLLIYALYAWGMPILLCFVVLLIQTYTNREANYNPKIGDQKCFLDGPLPNLLYFYGEAAILIFINITLFGMTAHKIRQVKKQTKMLKQSDSQKHNYEKDKRKFVLFVKLLLAMGINWSMEIISWAVIWATGETYNKIWYVTDFCNAAYGVFIFFIFVFKKKIWQLLQKRYYTFMGKPHLARTIVSTTQQTNASSGYSSADTHLTDRTDLRSSAGTNVTNGVHIRPEEVALQRVRSA